MKTITKEDAKFISKRFYDFHDKVCKIVRQMMVIQNEFESSMKDESPSLNHYCIARHDKNIIVANYYSSQSRNNDIQFPLSYLHDDNWQTEYILKLTKEQEETSERIIEYNKGRDLKEIERLRKLYPDLFKSEKS